MYRLQSDQTLSIVAYSGKSTNADSINAPAGPRLSAVSNRANLYVPWITTPDRRQTHSTATQSELITLIRLHDEIIGAIDIESDLPDAFNATEQAAVGEVADALAALL
jgi:putative methionine-R-sulfoxide reductase with GAF domain